MTVSELLIVLAKHKSDATVYVQDPLTDDAVPVTAVEAHRASVVLKAEVE